MVRVEICGGIASGKTTLAKLLRRALLFPIMEDFRRNPFLTDFYADPKTYALETELSFLLQHYHAVKRARAHHTAVCDFSFFLDLAYANVTLSKQEGRHFQSLYRVLTGHLRPPSALIYLQCPAQEELRRIRARRRAREKTISVAYLKGLDQALSRVVGSLSTPPILTLDSHALDFAHNPKHCSAVVATVKQFLA